MSNETRGPLSGFRDTLPDVMIPRNSVIADIREVYQSYGFVPLDTPAVERMSTLSGKAGEGDNIIYKVVGRGDTEMGLRFDLTVPLARVVAQHGDRLPNPFKRYQVANVWRGERPQKGRFREFMQFDADTVGSSGTMADAEVVAMMHDAMEKIGVDTRIRVNNRTLLDALGTQVGIEDPVKGRALVSIIDKVDKIGLQGVLQEIEMSFDRSVANAVNIFLSSQGTSQEKLQQMESLLGKHPSAQEGIENLTSVFSILRRIGLSENDVIFDPSIARGLNYYTGIIFETELTALPQIGSVCSGGRFDNLIHDLGGPQRPAVGASIGVDRLFTALQELGKVESVSTATQVMIANFIDTDGPFYMTLAQELRRNGIPAEVFLDSKRLKDQISYTSKVGIPLMVLAGPNELVNGIVKIKNMQTGEITDVDLNSAASTLISMLS